MIRNKFLFNFTVLSVFILSGLSVSAQSASMTIRLLDNIVVSLGTKSSFSNAASDIPPFETIVVTSADKKKQIISKYFPDLKNNLYFGYDIEVNRLQEKDLYSLKIKPLSIDVSKVDPGYRGLKPKQPIKFPDELTVRDGDIITLNFLENVITNSPVTEYLRVTDTSKYPNVTSYISGLFSEVAPTRDFTIEDTVLKLKKFQVFANGKKIGEMGGGGWGAVIYFTLPSGGRFILSPFSRKGYNFQKIGVAIDNKLSFTHEGIKYEVISGNSILSEGGNWYIWVLHDPSYKKKIYTADPMSVEFGSADKVESFFEASK